MKNRKQINFLALITALFFFSSSSNAQRSVSEELNWSKIISSEARYAAGQSNDYLVMTNIWYENKDGEVISVIDKEDLSIITRNKKLDLKADGQALKYAYSYVFNNKLIVLAFKDIKVKYGEPQFNYILRYSLPKLELEETIEVGNLRQFVGNGFGSNGSYGYRGSTQNNPSVQFKVSKNNKWMMLIFETTKDYSKPLSFEYQILDSDFNQKKGTVEIEKLPGKAKDLVTIISNDGEPYIYYKRTIKKQDTYYLLDVIEKKHYKIDLPILAIDQKIQEFNGKIIIDGVCYHDGSYKIYSYSFDIESKSFDEPIYTYFDNTKSLEYLKKGEAKKALSKPKKHPAYDYVIEYIDILPNGGKYIYGECIDVMTRDVNTYTTQKEIFIFHIGADGKLIYYQLIPRWAYRGGLATMDIPYIRFFVEDNLHIILEDHPDNQKLDVHKKHSKHTINCDAVTFEYIINPDGKIHRTIWSDTKKPFYRGSFNLGDRYIIGTSDYNKKEIRFTYTP